MIGNLDALISFDPSTTGEIVSETVAEVFVNYRSDDSGYAASEIFHRLVDRFGAHQVFHAAVIVPGTVYPQTIRAAVERCDALVAVIGPRWLTATDEKGRRIDNDRDWVHMELRRAFQRGIPVVPVLLDNTPILVADQLPSDLRVLANTQVARVRRRHLTRDVTELIEHLTALVPGLKDPAQATESEPRTVQQPAPPPTYSQHIKGKTVFANQGGSQHINYPRGGTDPE